jgi:NitT/TauT family transport system substrate-binding protein
MSFACAPAASPPAAPAQPAVAGEPAAAAPTAAPARVPARMAYPNISLSFLPMIVARDVGYYAEEGLDAELIEMRANVGQAALIAGEVDYTVSLGSNVKMALQGAPIKTVFLYMDAPVFLLVAQPQYRTVADLRGRTIGVGVIGAVIDQITRLTVKHYGLDPANDVQIIPVGDGAVQYQSLQLGQVDAVMMSLPFPIAARREGFSVVVNVADVLKMPASGVGTLQSTIDTRRDEVRRMLRAQIRALEYIRAEPAASSRIIGEFFAMDAETARESYGYVLPAFTRPGIPEREAMETLLDVERAEGTVTGPITYERAVDPSIAEQAARELGVAAGGR